MLELGGGDKEVEVELTDGGGPNRSFAGVLVGDLGGCTFGAKWDLAVKFWRPNLSLIDGLLVPRRDLIPVGACVAGLGVGAAGVAELVRGPRRALTPVGAGTTGLGGGPVEAVVLEAGALGLDCKHGYSAGRVSSRLRLPLLKSWSYHSSMRALGWW